MARESLRERERKRVEEEYHTHACACGENWSHRQNELGATHVARTEAHMCPRCGKGPWVMRVKEPGMQVTEHV